MTDEPTTDDTGRLRAGSLVRNVLDYASAGGKVPTNVANTTGTLATFELETRRAAALARQKAEDALAEVRFRDREKVADHIQMTIAKLGPDGLKEAADLFTDPVPAAEQTLADARRFEQGVNDARKGQAAYLGSLIGNGAYEDMIRSMERFWRDVVVLDPLPSWTLKKLATAEAESSEARRIVSALLVAVEGAAANATSPGDLKLIRDAVKEERPTLPTMSVLRHEAAEKRADSPAALKALAREEAEKARKDKIRREAAEAAAYRLGRKPGEANEDSEATVSDDNEAAE